MPSVVSRYFLLNYLQFCFCKYSVSCNMSWLLVGCIMLLIVNSMDKRQKKFLKQYLAKELRTSLMWV